MSEVTVREIRNHGRDVLDRVAQGEALTVTRDGEPVAELRPLPKRPVPAAILLGRWKQLPPVSAERLRSDIDAILDSGL